MLIHDYIIKISDFTKEEYENFLSDEKTQNTVMVDVMYCSCSTVGFERYLFSQNIDLIISYFVLFTHQK